MTRVVLVLLLACACSQSKSFVMTDDGGIAQVCGPGYGGCPSGELCDFPDDRCGEGELGQCVVDLQACPDIFVPVCVCGGSLETNPCYANRDVDARGSCDLREGTHACGFRVCNDNEFCVAQRTDRGTYYDCGFYLCPERTCDCVDDDRCEGTCSEEAGRATLRCSL